jgi:hypothetical protein
VGFSRDGFHWDRPDRRAFLPVNDVSAMGAEQENAGAWNRSNVQSAGGVCLVVGDKLYFYCSGRTYGQNVAPANSTGLALLRRDGFASMDAGEGEGVLTTRLIRFQGKHLFVNVDGAGGSISAEVLDADGKVILPFSRSACVPVRADTTCAEVRWQAAEDLSTLAGEAVRLRFYVQNAKFYSFWVSPDASGASYGYVAAGGPGLTGPVDTVGSSAST